MNFCRTVFVALLTLGLVSSEIALAAEQNLDRTLEKLAASILRECPELQGDERTSEARKRLVDEFRKFKVDTISRAQLKKIRRNKVDYRHYSWTHIVKSYEQGHFKEPKMKFLLKKAKAQKMRGEEHYVVSRLMLLYYELKVGERTQASRRGLSHLGKEYTAYLKLNGNPPKDLETLQVDVAKRVGVDPLTGSESQWVYIGQGPAEIRGGNRYRVIAYAPFATGNELAYRWVVYKGGQLGVWKTKTLVAAVEKMERENLMLLKPPVAVVDKVVKNKSIADGKTTELTKKESKSVSKAKLKITIRELW
ncbi:MAG: hypothetical protein ACI9FG_002064 [Crocinitomicaceae bacterium]|jgi:hypothetical protein